MKQVLTSIWFLALIIAIPVIWIFPPVFNKYKIEIQKEGRRDIEDNANLYFEDLDSDGKPERIISFSQKNKFNTFSFIFYDENDGIIDQVNFPFKYNMETSLLYFADIDNNRNKEVYTFSVEKDSLILHWLELTPKVGKIQSLPLCEINHYNDSLIDYSFHKIHCVDLENDGKKELVFTLIGGYSYSPRQILKIDIENRIVSRSKNTGSASGPIQFYDLNGDGKLEIIADGQVAPVRDWFNLSMNEPAPYLKVFDSDLNYFFPPVKFFDGIQSITSTKIYDNNGEKELVCTFLSSSSECIPFRVYKINIKGEITDSLAYYSENRQISKFVFQNEKGNCMAQIEPSVFMEYNSEPEIVRLHNLKTGGNLSFATSSDINEDGFYEYFFIDHKGNLVVFSDHFKWHQQFQLDGPVTIRENLKLKKGQFYVATDKNYLIYSFKRNSLYFFRFPVYLGIYLLCLLLVFLYQKVIEGRIKEKYELKNQVRELQLKTFRNQLNPHFIFNTFNGIASVIKKGDSEKAYEVFMRFSKLVRHILENFDDDFIPLELELELIYNFIELQKFRYKDLFDYEIKVQDKRLNDFQLPRMILQIHVENAIKHGLIPKGGKGFLQVLAEKENEDLKIIIEDNGIGREKAGELENVNHGIGIKSIEGIIANINFGAKEKIAQKIIDLKDDENRACGTRVEIIIPKRKVNS